MEFMMEELRFKNNVIDCLFKLVSVLCDERFSSCKSERTEVVSKKLVHKSVDPCETSLGVANSDGNVNLIDDNFNEISSYLLLITITIILKAKKTNLMTSILPKS